MSARRYHLLTGGTGLLGRYLLRDLQRFNLPLAVLARDTPAGPAADRVRTLTAFWEDALGTQLPPPVVLAGDLREPGLGLTVADRAWLGRHCGAIVHAAADVTFRSNADGEPWRTNADGTRRLLALAAGVGIPAFHHVSTAFVCGNGPGPHREDGLDCRHEFRNDYEESKHAAERAVRLAAGVRATVYRPAVIVGDSRTGYTSTYHGPYRFLAAAHRLARRVPTGTGERARRHLPLRLPFDGREARNLVPVDWVARAMALIVRRPARHGRTYHLVARRPTPVADILAVAEAVLGLDGIELTGRHPADPTPVEDAFLGAVRDYWPYLGGDPAFDDCNTRAVLPRLPPPKVDRRLLTRLVGFAVADRWGRGRRPEGHAAAVDCGDYIERYFPGASARSFLAGLPIDATLGFDIRGPGGGEWICHVRAGRVVEVTRGPAGTADAAYRLDVPTFAAVVAGRETPQAAFFDRRIEIRGRVETGLKLATLFARFVREFPYTPDREGQHVANGAR
jgi:thioester reductase-like protein